MMNEETKNYIDQRIQQHWHKGHDSARINLFDVFGLIETVDAVPTGKPKTFSEQLKIYKNSTTYRLYWYDSVNDQWRYATGT